MSRIRSIHPGFFTDEELVSVSMEARLLFLGLGVEADDKGIFEWKPITLKMRLFPADNLDITCMLEELQAAGAIKQYEAQGRKYGAIRNFRKFQRPKSPNDVHPAPADIRNYVGLEKTGSETPDAEQSSFSPIGEIDRDEDTPFPQLSEIRPQMEDGGDKMEEIDSPSDSLVVDEAHEPQVFLPVLADQPDDTQIAFDRHDALRREFHSKAKRVDLTPARRKKLAAVLKQVGGLGGWAEVLSTIRNSRFLRGETSDRPFPATIDFVLSDEKLRKIQEGFYDDNEQRNHRGSANGRDPRGSDGAVDAVSFAINALGSRGS